MNHQVLLLFSINLFSAMGYSLIAPLYPTLGHLHKINEEVLGWIISIFALFNFFITPFAPYLSMKFGRKKIFYLATFFEACCTVLYGFLHFIQSTPLFIFCSFLTRIFHGLGSGITGTLVYSLVSSVSEPSEIKMALGYLEIAWSLGVAIGPLIGSFLFHIGGYPLPFYVLGCSLFISVYLIHYLSLPEQEEAESSPNFVGQLLKINIILNLIPVIIYLMSNTYYFPSLTNHLTIKWGLSVEMASAFFIIPMLVYFITLQFLDIYTNRFGLIFTEFTGLILIGIGGIFVFPLSFLPQIIISVILGLGFLGASGSGINVPALILLGKLVKENDKNLNEFQANDIASALYNFAVNIGDFCGPIFGGRISERYGFNYSCGYMSLIGFVYAIIFGIVNCKQMLEDIRSGNNNIEGSTAENPFLEDETFKISGEKKFGIPVRRKHTSNSSIHKISITSNHSRETQ